MKKTNRIISLFLVISMVACMLPMMSFATDEKVYLALGDSISTGYGLDNADTESFPALIAEELGSEWTLVNKAVDGATTDSLLTKLGTQEYKTAVESADAITLTIGGNDLMDLLYNFLAEDLNITVDEVKTNLASGDMTFLTSAAESLNSGRFDPQPEEFAAIAGNVQDVVDAIRALNEDAVLVVNTQYDPYVELGEQVSSVAILVAMVKPELGPLLNAILFLVEEVEAAVTALNTDIKAKAGTDYAVADVYTAFDNARAADDTLTLCNAKLDTSSYGVNMDFHPNAAGHAVIAETVLDVLVPLLPTHTHAWSYSATGETITAVCTDGCDYEGTDIQLTIVKPANLTYDGVPAKATLSATSIAGQSTLPDIKYIGRGSTSYAESTTAPTGAGTYTAKITIGGKTASVDYEIAKAIPNVTWPSGLEGNVGDKLSTVALSDTSFKWSDENELIAYGQKSYELIYTPSDTDNYISMTSNVTVDGKDITVPVITGITDGKTYCEAVSFDVNEDHLDRVEVNGTAVTEYTLTPSAQPYTVVAYDESGNQSASITVTVNDGHTFDVYDSDNDLHWFVCRYGCVNVVDNDSYEEHTKEYAESRATDEHGTYLAFTCTECEHEGKDYIYTLEIPYTTVIKQTGDLAPGKETFKLELAEASHQGLDFALVDCTVETDGTGDFDNVLKIEIIGEVAFWQMSEGFAIRQIKGNLTGWTYSDAVWYAAYHEAQDGIEIAVFDITGLDLENVEEWPEPQDKMVFENSYKANKPTEIIPDTGDNPNLWLFAVIFFVSGLGVATTFLVKKRKNV